jgi:terminase large subunit-like protein
MPAKPGTIQRRKKPQSAPRKRGRRPTVPAIEPLHHTFDASKPAGARFDEAAAKRAIRWIESRLRHFQGEWAGRPLLLLPWQARIVRELFGWKRANGTRLYRVAYVEAPSKTGKSTFATAIAAYLAYADGEAAPQVLFAAFDRDQADVCYSIARHMVEAEPELLERRTHGQKGLCSPRLGAAGNHRQTCVSASLPKASNELTRGLEKPTSCHCRKESPLTACGGRSQASCTRSESRRPR